MSIFKNTLNITADGNHVLTDFRPGGYGYGYSEWQVLFISGSFGGGTLSVQAYDENHDAWVTIPGLDALTAATVERFQVPADNYRLVLTGATAPDIDVSYF